MESWESASQSGVTSAPVTGRNLRTDGGVLLLVLLALVLCGATGSLLSAQEPDGSTDAIDRAIDQELQRVSREEGQVRYRGQYRTLAPLGHECARRLLGRLLDEGRTFDHRQSCANALMDVAGKELVSEVERTLREDLLLEVWVERELVLLLAKLGQRERVDQWMKELQAVAGQAPNTATLPAILDALSRLGDLQFRSGLVREAAGTHRQRIDLLGDIAARVRPELGLGLKDEQKAIHYNLACCHALLGEQQQALEALEISLGASTIRLEMAQVDGDLKSLRELPQWNEWVKKYTIEEESEDSEGDQR